MLRRAQKGQVTRIVNDDVEMIVVDVAPAASLDPRGVLTAAEREVAQLALDGCSDAEIASRRGTSRSTVANQLGRIYRKLGVASRVELVALALQDAPPPEHEAPGAR
jgi:DNA-binding CsgD family transcriptional regulator